MIKNILFDMGQVLIRFDQAFFINRLGIDGDDRDLLMREVFRSVEWVRMDRGTLREEEAFESIAPRLPHHLHDAARKLLCMWDRPILEIEGMYELVAELKERATGSTCFPTPASASMTTGPGFPPAGSLTAS